MTKPKKEKSTVMNRRKRLKDLADSKPQEDIDKSQTAIFLEQITQKMIENKVVPTPSNYALYFEKHLEEQDDNFKQEIHKILSIQKDHSSNSMILEQKLKESLKESKEILKIASSLYKNTVIFQNISKKYFLIVMTQEKNTHYTRQQDFFLNHISSASLEIKEAYGKIMKSLKDFGDHCIFNGNLCIHNKSYLLKRIEQEIELVHNAHHKSCFVMIKIDWEEKQGDILKKSAIKYVARVLKRSTKTNDIIGYYESYTYGLILPHQGLEDARTLVKRTLQRIKDGEFIIDGKGHTVKVVAGITAIEENFEINEVIYHGLRGIDIAYKNLSEIGISTLDKIG